MILVLTAFQNATLGSQKDTFLRGLEVDHVLFDFLSASEEWELAIWHSSRSWSAAEGNLWRSMVATFLFLRGTVWQFATFGAFVWCGERNSSYFQGPQGQGQGLAGLVLSQDS